MSLEVDIDKKKTHKDKPDMLKVNKLYSITINPENQCYESTTGRLKRIVKRVKRHMDMLTCEYCLYYEYSTPKWNGCAIPRLHFHGFIYWRNSCQLGKFYEVDYVRLTKIGYFELDTINDAERWQKYSSKNSTLIHKFIRKLEVPYPISSLMFHKSVIIQFPCDSQESRDIVDER